MLLMIDNYDSFTYNLVQYLAELGQDVRTVRNDAIDLDGIEALAAVGAVVLARRRRGLEQDEGGGLPERDPGTEAFDPGSETLEVRV